MNVQLFVVSFQRDAEFLRYLLKSIQKFTTGFAGTTVVVPDRDLHDMGWVADMDAGLYGYDEHPTKGMLHHEWQKLCADKWCHDAEAILYLDSDCIFWEPCTPTDFFVHGKPILYRERWESMVNKNRLKWRTAVKAAIGLDCPYETMVRHPMIHLPETCAATRKLIADNTGRDPESYVLSCRNEFPQSFAEFPTLGTVAHHFFNDRYHWVDFNIATNDGGYEYARGRDKLCAAWSHHGFDRYRKFAEDILAGTSKSERFSPHEYHTV